VHASFVSFHHRLRPGHYRPVLLGEAYKSIGTVDLGLITLIGAVPAMTRAQGCRCPMTPSLIGAVMHA
jgi:hypothetical protein